MVVFLSQSWAICLIFSFFFLFSSGRFLFHKNCGQFISLDSNRTTARRVDSYNHGVVLSETPLPDNHLFQVSFSLNSPFDEITALHFFNQRQQTTIPNVLPEISRSYRRLRACRRLHLFPRLPPVIFFFPRLPPVTFFSRACRRLHFFSRLPPVTFFPRFPQLLIFPLSISYLFPFGARLCFSLLVSCVLFSVYHGLPTLVQNIL